MRPEEPASASTGLSHHMDMDIVLLPGAAGAGAAVLQARRRDGEPPGGGALGTILPGGGEVV